MTILLFGVSNVGKTTVGELLAQKLECDFYDLDDEVKTYYNTTLEAFVNSGTLKERDRKRGKIIGELMGKSANKVIAIAPMSYQDYFRKYIQEPGVVAIELWDTAENIFKRLVFSDENDQIYKDDEYKTAHKDYYIDEISRDLEWYGKVYSGISKRFDMRNDPPDIIVNRLLQEFNHLLNG